MCHQIHSFLFLLMQVSTLGPAFDLHSLAFVVGIPLKFTPLARDTDVLKRKAAYVVHA